MAVVINGTTGVSGVDGSAGTPSYQGTDSNTGIFFPAADTIAFAEGGAEAMRLDSSGNVGIGVTPSAWRSASKVLQVGTTSVFRNEAGLTVIGDNSYTNSSNQNIYITNGYATNYVQTSGQHLWYTAPSGTAGNAITFTQVLAVEKDKSLALQGATSQSGTGITFPATQSASTDANTLDDYEEGTWTPSLLFGGGSTGMTYNATGRVGTYTKIGRFVYYTLWIQLTAKGTSTGDVTVSGLPFTSANITSAYNGIPIPHWNNISTVSFVGGYFAPNTANIVLTGGSPPTDTKTSLTHSNFNNDSYFLVSFCSQTV